jgi:hypothetical protein
MKISKLKLAFLSIALICFVCSCGNFKDSNIYTQEELDKHLEGSWGIAKVIRNGLDITSLMDFSQFKITFNPDLTYSIDNYLPFLVRENGTWNINDPKYPNLLIFVEDGADTEKISDIDYIIVEGERQIILTFTPGYKDNTYTYTLERVN